MYLLHTWNDKFIIEIEQQSHPHSSNQPLSHLLIDRTTGESSVHSSIAPISDASCYSERIHLVIGVVQLLRCKYLIVANHSVQVANIEGFIIRQVVDCKIIPFSSDSSYNSSPSLSHEEYEDEQKYLQLLHLVLRSAQFYFSYDYDLTLTQQRISEFSNDPIALSLPIWKRADTRFFWNHYLSQDLIHAHAHDFIIPIMNGYVFQQSLNIIQSEVNFVLISRRSVQRAGKRFVTRGIDLQGNAANFAETEQAIFIHPKRTSDSKKGIEIMSYVQTRGSVPVLWEQPVTLKYAPKIKLLREGKESELAFRRHFEEQTKTYGRNIGINLVNQKGAELLLVRSYQQQVNTAKSNLIRLVNFDFHHECRKMKYENLNKLLAIVKDEFQNMAYFHALLNVNNTINQENTIGINYTTQPQKQIKYEIYQLQKSVFRTNCVDCLDRTNVVQSVFGKKLLEEQLCKVLHLSSNTQLPVNLQHLFRNMWANNGDAMSNQYSGTGAMKSDYTRTGSRTWKGALQDGVYSLTRYYLNNFKDGNHQDALDLFLGLYQPSTQHPSPFAHKRIKNLKQDVEISPAYQRPISSFAMKFTAALFIIFAAFTFLAPPILTPHRNWSHATNLILFSFVAVFIGSKMIMRYGRLYTNKPSLRPLGHF